MVGSNTATCLAVLSCIAGLGMASNILLASPAGTQSQVNFYGEIVRALTERGHTVTVISSDDIRAHPNVTHINVGLKIYDLIKNSFSLMEWGTTFKMMLDMPRVCSDALENKEVQKLNIDDFDLFINRVYISECFLSLIDKSQIPLILLLPNTITSFIESQMGVIGFPSIVPAKGMEQRVPMTFFGRLKSTISSLCMNSVTKDILVPLNDRECRARGLCPQDMTPLVEIERRASLIFLNSVRSLEIPAAYPSNVVLVGGLNCKPAKPLPQELQEWADKSGDAGFIYFSLGSAVKPSDMPEEQRKILVRVFSSLPQQVLWKWDAGDMSGLPTNVKLDKWLPQQDVLGHKNCKLFMSHGGLFGTLEAIYHSVPMLGMPIFTDQFTNIDKVVLEGWGDVINWSELSEDLLLQKITELVSNPRYGDSVRARSRLMRDEPMPAHDRVAYWTEYVIRHNGAPHLRSPVLDMTWYSVYNIDVWLFMIVSLVTVAGSAFKATLAMVRCCCRKRTSVKQKKH